MALPALPDFTQRVVDGRDELSSSEAREAMRIILAGGASEVQIAAFLVALRVRGERAGEVAGFARAMREAAGGLSLAEGGELLDTCGTGGDRSDTFNISTVAAFVAAGAGVRVAKHGNRSISSQCGSADLLEALGVALARTPEEAVGSMREAGIAFLYAPAFHRATRHVQPVRRELRMRTVFNVLGPLTNPAGATCQVVGAYSREAAGTIAAALGELGMRRALVVHGSDGLDEVTTTGSTAVFSLRGGRVEEFTLEPEAFGIAQARPGDLRGGGPARNAAIACEVLEGGKGPRRDVVVANAALALMAAGMAEDPASGARLAESAIDSGAARCKLEALIRYAAPAIS